MDMLVGLISSLKLNNTLFVQFLIFLVAYAFLYYVLFKPYNNAAQLRYDRTTGNEENADKYDEEIELLKRKYGQKIKEINTSVTGVFSEFDERGKKEASALMLEAQQTYKAEKDQKEKDLNDHYLKERDKVPALTQDLKAQLKKVLAGA
ncbi:MAG: ATP synthase F0 subunit B [Bdellovibrionales bacterium]